MFLIWIHSVGKVIIQKIVQYRELNVHMTEFVISSSSIQNLSREKFALFLFIEGATLGQIFLSLRHWYSEREVTLLGRGLEKHHFLDQD